MISFFFAHSFNMAIHESSLFPVVYKKIQNKKRSKVTKLAMIETLLVSDLKCMGPSTVVQSKLYFCCDVFID